jgi:hypothetical protein
MKTEQETIQCIEEKYEMLSNNKENIKSLKVKNIQIAAEIKALEWSLTTTALSPKTPAKAASNNNINNEEVTYE